MDTGCHLHYPVWDSQRPFGIDLPMHMRGLYGNFTTETVNLRIYSVSRNEWIDSFPLTAWDIKHCNGPLTMNEEQWPLKPN